MPKKLTAHQRLSRRETFRLAGVAGAMALVGRNLAGESCAAQGTGSPACVVTPAQTEGPYFVDEKLNRSDIRSDPTDNTVHEGVPLALKLTVHRVENGACTPLTGATVDIWHCDAHGLYSDEAANGTVGKKFLRGYQVTDANGAVQFTTIYPGWYMGRTIHIHFKVRLYAGPRKTYEFTSQLYFDETHNDAVLAQAPYSSRGTRRTRNSTDGIFTAPGNDGTGKQSGDLLMAVLTKAEHGYQAAFDIGLTLT
jgi:protocatechuate 3,4-dioxygenase beta subunit